MRVQLLSFGSTLLSQQHGYLNLNLVQLMQMLILYLFPTRRRKSDVKALVSTLNTEILCQH